MLRQVVLYLVFIDWLVYWMRNEWMNLVCMFATVFWKTGNGEDQHPEKRGVDPSQPSLPAVCHQRWGKLTVRHQVRPTGGTHLTMCICVTQLYEEVRKSLEQCNIQEDIEHFINLRRTGDKPPGTRSSKLSQQHLLGRHPVRSNEIHAAEFVWGWKIPHQVGDMNQ